MTSSTSIPADLARALAQDAGRLGPYGHLQHHATVTSTNDLAMTLAAAGAPEGTSVLADVQEAGRGRRGRTWFSPAGSGIYLSVVLRPGPATRAASLLTLAAGVAAAQGVQRVSGLPVELKWPNDLVIGRPWRKLGGVLCEALAATQGLDAVVVGIGINVLRDAFPRDIASRATSIETELGRPIERTPLVVEILAGLRSAVHRLYDGDDDGVRDEWRQLGRAGLGGAAVTWRDQDLERRGAARDIAADGALIVESDGRVERLVAGEVHWEQLSRG